MSPQGGPRRTAGQPVTRAHPAGAGHGGAQPTEHVIDVDGDGRTVIVVQQQQQQGVAQERIPGVATSHIIAFVAPLLAIMMLLAGHAAIDDLNPDKGMARTSYLVALTFGLAAPIGALFLPSRWIALPIGTAASGVLALWFISMLDDYGPDASGAGPVTMTLLLFFITMGVLAATLSGRRAGPASTLSIGLALSMGAAWTALYLLANLDEAALRAEEAWSRDTPGPAVLLLILTLVLGAVFQRRRARAE